MDLITKPDLFINDKSILRKSITVQTTSCNKFDKVDPF